MMDERQPLTKDIFEQVAHLHGAPFEENADTLLGQLATLANKPVSRFIVPLLDHDDRKRVLAQLRGNNWMLTIKDSFVLHEETPFYFTHVEVLALSR